MAGAAEITAIQTARISRPNAASGRLARNRSTFEKRLGLAARSRRVAGKAPAAGSGMVPLSNTHPRIDHDLQHVDDKIDKHVNDRNHAGHAHDRWKIQRGGGAAGVSDDPEPGED